MLMTSGRRFENKGSRICGTILAFNFAAPNVIQFSSQPQPEAFIKIEMSGESFELFRSLSDCFNFGFIQLRLVDSI